MTWGPIQKVSNALELVLLRITRCCLAMCVLGIPCWIPFQQLTDTVEVTVVCCVVQSRVAIVIHRIDLSLPCHEGSDNLLVTSACCFHQWCASSTRLVENIGISTTFEEDGSGLQEALGCCVKQGRVSVFVSSIQKVTIASVPGSQQLGNNLRVSITCSHYQRCITKLLHITVCIGQHLPLGQAWLLHCTHLRHHRHTAVCKAKQPLKWCQNPAKQCAYNRDLRKQIQCTQDDVKRPHPIIAKDEYTSKPASNNDGPNLFHLVCAGPFFAMVLVIAKRTWSTAMGVVFFACRL
mmetsp:Transcript_54107/g.107693  ORF Transcript_54107/g.107693 Transcript_54107/m.107693 type:complete len:293 (+) Transcript_54107:1318-2196(+)